MGREIRRVPKGWEHPRDEDGHFRALYDQDYQSAAEEWWEAAVAWQDGSGLDEHEQQHRLKHTWYWDWDGGPPDKDSHRPAFAEPADHFQIYETVSEGSPVSPVFASAEELVEWMCQPIDWSSEYNRGADWQCMQGRSRESAEAFVEAGSVCSFMVSPGRGIADGVEALVSPLAQESRDD